MTKCVPHPRQNTSRPANSGTNGIGVQQSGQTTSSMANPAPPPEPLTFFATATLPGIEAVTDAERVIPLLRYDAVAVLAAGQQLVFHSDRERRDFLARMEQKFLANTNQSVKDLVQVTEPDLRSNCHGWIFTGGRFVVHDAQIPSILADNGYHAVEEPVEGDLSVFARNGNVKHSGIVRRSADNALFIESKWGPFSVYRHSLEAHPYPRECTFYRGLRNSHLLKIR